MSFIFLPNEKFKKYISSHYNYCSIYMLKISEFIQQLTYEIMDLGCVST